jgi:chorismate synthase
MNSFGNLFKLSIFGESHGLSVGITVDGCPAGFALSEKDFRNDLARRKSGARGTTPRKETDTPRLISGIFNGFTTGAPITILFENSDVRPADYASFRETPRPGHADFVAMKKFGGFEDYRGGGHFSGRLTLALVAAGVLAKKVIDPITCKARLIEAGGKSDIQKAIEEAVAENDSIGGLAECRITRVPVGLGEPFFNSVESLVSHMIFSIPAIKGIEFGSGFRSAAMKGSEHNDEIINADGTTRSNNAGGINGGISNGNEIIFRVAVKPTSSTGKSQKTVNITTGQMTDLRIQGRHDTCIALRVPVILEAAAAVVIADLLLAEQKVKRIIT